MDKQQMEGTFPIPNHDGQTYAPGLDKVRLNSQLRRVYDLMQDGAWRTLPEIQAVAGGSEAAVSARLRDLRKPKFGGYEVMSRRRGDEHKGLHEYSLTVGKNRETYPEAPVLGQYPAPKRDRNDGLCEMAAKAYPKPSLLGLVQVKQG